MQLHLYSALKRSRNNSSGRPVRSLRRCRCQREIAFSKQVSKPSPQGPESNRVFCPPRQKMASTKAREPSEGAVHLDTWLDRRLDFDIPALAETGWPFPNPILFRIGPLRTAYLSYSADLFVLLQVTCELQDLSRHPDVTSILLILIHKYDSTLKDNLKCKQEPIKHRASTLMQGSWGACILSTHKRIHLQINRG